MKHGANRFSVVTAAMAVLATTGAYAVNLATGYYFRYDFSGGIKEFGGTTSQSADPCKNTNIGGSGVYGQDGVNTAFYIDNTAVSPFRAAAIQAIAPANHI
ncbi:MAG: hypothetical protein IJQ00_11925 [Kiritimatiellae bacterium]|nr:hypothetical protein [Kiritimatiellia bacterium]